MSSSDLFNARAAATSLRRPPGSPRSIDPIPGLEPPPERSLRLDEAPAGLPASSFAWKSAARIGVATLLTMLPVTLIVPALKELVTDRFGTGAFWTHAFQSINLLGAVMATPLIAALCDRAASRRTLVVLALLLDAALLGAMAVVPTLTMLLAVRFCEGAAHMLALSALMSTAADLAPAGQRGRFMGLLGACMMFGTATGTRLGGLVWRAWPGASFEAAALIAIAAALYVALVLRNPDGRNLNQPFASVRAVLARRPQLWIPLAYTFVDRFCVGVIISSFVLFLAEAHQIAPDARSRLLAMFLIPFAVLVYPAGKLVDRVGPTLPLTLGSAGFGLLFAAYGVIPLAWLPVAMLASGLLSAIMFAPTLSLCAELAPPEQRGAAYAGFNAAGSLGFLAGPILAGTLVHALQGPLGTVNAYRVALAAAGATQVLIVVATIGALQRMERAGIPR